MWTTGLRLVGSLDLMGVQILSFQQANACKLTMASWNMKFLTDKLPNFRGILLFIHLNQTFCHIYVAFMSQDI